MDLDNSQTKRALIVTGYACNNNCLFCSVNEKDSLLQRSYDDILADLIAERKNGCNEVEFIGGEVTIRKDILKLMGKAKEMGYQYITIETNGRMFSYPEFAGKMARAGLTHVFFSVHGHCSQIHDRLTNAPGSFDQAVAGIKNLGKFKEIDIRTNYVLTSYNYKYVKDFIEKFSLLSINDFYFSFIQPMPLTIKNNLEIIPRLEKVAFYLNQILDSYSHLDIIVQHLPACLLPGHQYAFLLAKEKEDTTVSSEADRGNTLAQAVHANKIKPQKCIGCRLNHICDGLWKEYYNLFGDEELKPQ